METNRKVLQWLCMFPPDSQENGDASKTKRMIYVTFTAINVITLSILALASAAFIKRFVMIDLESSLYALFPTSACTGLIYMIIIGILSQHRIASMFENIYEIYSLCKQNNIYSIQYLWKIESRFTIIIISDDGKDSFQFLVKANDKCEKMWKLYIKYGIVGHFIGNIFMFVLAIVGCYLTYQRIDVQYLYRPYREMWIKFFDLIPQIWKYDREKPVYLEFTWYEFDWDAMPFHFFFLAYLGINQRILVMQPR